ncbi:diaminopimelate decarboxylase [Jonquetella sp. BV3C21]|nr:diaminopimelate decarboxylase [Jonquetella anthropi E3_33 E1]ERL23700.1 diaminopimelate decarboxylase [Jonquetella sp. BV3C21]
MKKRSKRSNVSALEKPFNKKAARQGRQKRTDSVKSLTEWGGASLIELAERFGTPLYVFDEAELRRRCRRLVESVKKYDADVYYAGKAFLPLAMAQLVSSEGMGLDVVSLGELALALSAGISAGRIELHGNAKTEELLSRALRLGVGRIVVDSADELELLGRLAKNEKTPPKILLRVSPGIAAGAHHAIQTATDDCKFGFSPAQLVHAVKRAADLPVVLAGLHVHLGSQIDRLEPFFEGVQTMVDLLASLKNACGFEADEMDLGGGFAVRSPEGPLDAGDFIEKICLRAKSASSAAGLRLPRLSFEPGRWVSSPACVTVYRVQSVKETTSGRIYAALDGGMTDNPRPCLYGAPYSPVLVSSADERKEGTVTLAGCCCESGDVLVSDAVMPELRRGDLVALPDTGAYTYSMFMTYNGAFRPAVVFVSSGTARLVVRRWNEGDLLKDQLGLEGRQ